MKGFCFQELQGDEKLPLIAFQKELRQNTKPKKLSSNEAPGGGEEVKGGCGVM